MADKVPWMPLPLWNQGSWVWALAQGQQQKQPQSDMLRKRKYRDALEKRKARLTELVRVLLPETREGLGTRTKPKRRTTEDLHTLLRDAARCVKSWKTTEPERGFGFREGLLLSKTFGTLLVRREDLRVIESNLGMALFAPFERIKGYRGQSLRIMAHAVDAEELAASLGVGGARVGDLFRVRLMRVCDDEASGCLLTQYVRKELSVAFSDGTAVLLTCSLSDEDTAPLTASPEFLEGYVSHMERYGRGQFRYSSTAGAIEMVQWLLERVTVNDNAESSALITKLWQISMGFGDAMSHTLEDSARLYIWMGKGQAGRSTFQGALCLKLESWQSEWNHWMSATCTGKSFPVSATPGMESEIFFTVALPEADAGAPRVADAMLLNFCKGSLVGTSLLGFHEEYVHNPLQLLTGGTKAVFRDSCYLPDGERLPELEELLEAHAMKEVDFFHMPIGL